MANDRFPSYRYPITYHVMEDYKLLISGNPESAELLPSILVVNALGIVYHWADPAIPGKVKIFFDPKWAKYEE